MTPDNHRADRWPYRTIAPVQTPWAAIRRHRAEARQRLGQEYEARTSRRSYFAGTDQTDLSSIRTVWHYALDTLSARQRPLGRPTRLQLVGHLETHGPADEVLFASDS